jgi:glycosyltransferase involved in cell wall biosynthesis
VLAKLEPGGAQLSVVRVVRALAASGIRSRVLVGWASDGGLRLAERMGLAVEVYGEGGDQQWQADPGFARWLAPRLDGAAVVHAHMFGGWWAAAQAVGADVALVASEHNPLTWPYGRHDRELREGLRRVDRFYAHGPSARRAVLEAGLPADRLRAGVSPIQELAARPLRGLPVPRIVFAGRLHPEKGPDLLIDALALLRRAPPALLLGDGPQIPALARSIASLGLGDRVRLCGWQPRPARWIAGASVLVVPSREEAWSQTAVQAMALGVPVVGTDAGGLPETLGGGRGVVVPAEDPWALAQAIDDVLTGRRRTDLVAGRSYAARFEAGAVARSYAAAYGEMGGRLARSG